jgi:hypothetical protein
MRGEEHARAQEKRLQKQIKDQLAIIQKLQHEMEAEQEAVAAAATLAPAPADIGGIRAEAPADAAAFLAAAAPFLLEGARDASLLVYTDRRGRRCDATPVTTF